MDIRFLGKNLSVTEGMKDHFREKLAKLERYAPRLVESHVVLKKEKYFYQAEITLLAKNFRAYGDGQNKENIFTAIDQAYGRIEKQLKKFRERVKSHHGRGESRRSKSGSGQFLRPGAASSARGAAPEIVQSPLSFAKPMTPEEASLQLKISSEIFIAFINAITQQMNVLYKRKDGQHGWIAPEF